MAGETLKSRFYAPAYRVWSRPHSLRKLGGCSLGLGGLWVCVGWEGRKMFCLGYIKPTYLIDIFSIKSLP